MGLLNSIKDTASSFIGEKILINQLEKYGRVNDFKIDSKNKKFKLNITLKGETDPLEILIDKYEIINQNDYDILKISKISTSKEWMNILIEEMIKEKEIKIPGKYSKILALFI